MKKILVIEDNLEVRENISEILELTGYEVFSAENGKTGVDIAKSEKPDLIICDIMMPELDGYGVLYILSKDPETSTIPFIFLTAKADKSDFRKGMSMGADDYITKPFDETELLNSIETRLKKSEHLKDMLDAHEKTVENLIHHATEINLIEELSESRKTKTFNKKTTIYYEGDYPNYLYYINSGKVKTFKINEDGKEFITGFRKVS
jgi:DNA-binding response OmpR family regulator